VLYTNSPAMHSSLMREYSPNVSAPRSNMIIAIQRRYQNVVKDSTRQMQYNMLLGKKLSANFPTLVPSRNSFECVSSFPAFSLKQVPCVFSGLGPEKWILADKLTNEPLSWIGPAGCDFLEIYIVLRRSCHLKEFALTVAGGPGDAIYPCNLDIFVGPNLNQLSIVMQDLSIPRVAAGTKLYYEVPAHMWAAYEGPSFYDFGDAGGQRRRTRIFHFRFRGLSADHMAIGKIELYGLVPQSLEPSTQAYESLIKRETHNKVKNIIKALASAESSNSPQLPEEGISLSSNSSEGEDSNEAADFKDKTDHSSNKPMSTEMVDMFGVTPAFQGEEEELLRSPTASTFSAMMSDSEFKEQLCKNSKLAIVGNRDLLREVQQFGTEEVYARTVQNALLNKEEQSLDFTDTLELEYLRLTLGLTTAQRDQVLLGLRQSIDSYNPCRFIFLRDEKAEISMRRAARHKSSASKCHACKSALGFFAIGVAQCNYCYHKFCSSCVGVPTKIIEFMWDKPQPVCKGCQLKLVRQS